MNTPTIQQHHDGFIGPDVSPFADAFVRMGQIVYAKHPIGKSLGTESVVTCLGIVAWLDGHRLMAHLPSMLAVRQFLVYIKSKMSELPMSSTARWHPHKIIAFAAEPDRPEFKEKFAMLADDYPEVMLVTAGTGILTDKGFYISPKLSDVIYSYKMFDRRPSRPAPDSSAASGEPEHRWMSDFGDFLETNIGLLEGTVKLQIIDFD